MNGLFRNKWFLRLLAGGLLAAFIGTTGWHAVFSPKKELEFHSVWTETDRQQITEIHHFTEMFYESACTLRMSPPLTLEGLLSSEILTRISLEKNKLYTRYYTWRLLNVISDTAASGDASHSGIFGMTLLLYACAQGKNELSQHLLEMGADPNAEQKFPSSNNRDSITPLFYASSPGIGNSVPAASRVDLVKLLVSHGADLNRRGISDMLPFEVACQSIAQKKDQSSGYEQVARLLIEMGTDLSRAGYVSGKYSNPMNLPIRYGCISIVRLMLEKGINPNDARDGNPPLFISMGNAADLPIKRLLLNHGANPDIVWKDPDNNPKDPFPEEGRTPLANLCDHLFPNQKPEKKQIYIDSIRLLLEYNSNVNKASSDGETPLMLACRHLVDTDGNINETAVQAILLLLENGADVSFKNTASETAVQYIRKGTPETDMELHKQLPGLFALPVTSDKTSR